MKIENLMAMVTDQKVKQTIVVAHAIDPALFLAAEEAMKKRLASFIFVGPTELMKENMGKCSFEIPIDKNVTFVDAKNEKESASTAVQLIREGKGDILMKGMLSSSSLLKAVLNKHNGLRNNQVISHLAGFAIPNREKIFFVTDAAMNIAPTLSEKVQIIQNAVDALHKMGINQPKVAAVAAVETVNPVMQATLDAASLTQMNKRGQIKGCIVDGPLGFDNAISKESALQKGINSEVAGDADIIFVPTIEVGNILYKSLTYFANASVGGMIIGAKAPIILTSRTDSVESKLFSITMALSSSINS
ncbi:bifunctional enoyl-CoA hydratase/phosphate acetyltransferase [Evansella cellulosilytica]|uniref:bifunctional enoyl-CoA hydratase/phosphate acetyltransferase n=1 Tax=Evansella cellulosilytica TaxID=1413 RepID=UPI00059F154B|nr:bifunctional enoyl-CoA hydratase/phosphate acetyltransferase [Evansella cellulosilytica]